MAMQSKGDRKPLSAHIPRADAEKLAVVVELTGESRSEIVTRLVHAHLKSIDLERLANGRALPIVKAS